MEEKKNNKNCFTSRNPRKFYLIRFRIEILLHLGVPDNQILLHFSVPNNQIFLCFGVPDNQILLHFGVSDNCLMNIRQKKLSFVRQFYTLY